MKKLLNILISSITAVAISGIMVTSLAAQEYNDLSLAATANAIENSANASEIIDDDLLLLLSNESDTAVTAAATNDSESASKTAPSEADENNGWLSTTLLICGLALFCVAIAVGVSKKQRIKKAKNN